MSEGGGVVEMTGIQKIIKPSPIVLSDQTFLKRVPPRPVEFRQPGYEKLFDYSTLVYDVFEYGDELWAVGPPLLNLRKAVQKTKFYHGAERVWPRVEHLNRMARWNFSTNAPSLFARTHTKIRGLFGSSNSDEKLRLKLGGEILESVIGANHGSLFSGKRSLLTKSKNNDLQWIQDWVEFHVKVHGANALLFYDNGSDAYTLEDIIHAVKDIENLDVAVIVDWPFKWGPHGESSGLWDSDFAQHGMLEHARWRFLADARSVLYQDVDELALSKRSVFEIAETSAEGGILYEGRWIENILARPVVADTLRHANFLYYDPNVAPASNKWCTVPARNLPSEQWRVHWIKPAQKTDEVVHRHFRGVTTSWKIPRPRQSLEQSVHQVDIELARQFQALGLIAPDTRESVR